MKNLNKIIVGLELNESDSYLLHFVKEIIPIISPKEIQFINIHKEELPEDILEKFPEIAHNIDDHYIKEMVEETTDIKHFNTKITYQSIQGNILEEILKASNKSDIDLLIIGRKNDKHDRHLHYRKIIRKATSNIFIVPETETTNFNKILVPIDFSEYSKYSIEKAVNIAQVSKGRIILQNIYEVPTGYSKSGKSFLEFAKIMQKNAKDQCEKFLQNFDFKNIPYEIKYTLNDCGSTSKIIEATINNVQPDLLVLGSKGKNKFSAILVGSTAESLIGKRKIDIPILLTRIKTQSVSIWDAIKEL